MKRQLLFQSVFCLILFCMVPTEMMADTFEPDDVGLQDVDVYEYTYQNWDNANWAKWGSMSLKSKPGTRRRTYIWIDINMLQARATNLNRVELVLHTYLATGSKIKINIFRVTSPWNAGTGTYHSGQTEPSAPSGEITWNNQPGWDAQNIWSSSFAEKKERVPIRFDITKLVASWVSGEVPNYGLVLVGENESSANYQVVFDSSESSKSEFFPRIAVNESSSECLNKLWGTQVAGEGHARNAILDGNRLTLNNQGVIVSQSGEHAGYAIWSAGRAVLTVNEGGTSVGNQLPAGEYTVIAGLGDRLRKSSILLCIEELGDVSDDLGDCQSKLSGKQTKGWGHTKNAETVSKKITLQGGGTIISEAGNYDSYSLWDGGTQPVLYVPPGESGVGRTLPPGTYSVLPGFKRNQDVATVTLCFSERPRVLP